MKELNAVLTIAYRDLVKFLRDRPRLLATFIFPFLFVAVLGSSLQATLPGAGFNFLVFTFTGVLAQTLFQSTSSGIISLIQDRESDFSQEMFVSPISRYTIIFGKILGESFVAIAQAIGIIIFGLIIRVPISFTQILSLIPVAFVICLFGGAFGVLVLANLNNQRSANQIFPFIIFPQYFLAGVFNPIQDLPPVLSVLSKLAPMTYAVDLMRGVYYANSSEYNKVVLLNPMTDLLIILLLFTVFIVLGTFLFVRNERNR